MYVYHTDIVYFNIREYRIYSSGNPVLKHRNGIIARWQHLQLIAVDGSRPLGRGGPSRIAFVHRKMGINYGKWGCPIFQTNAPFHSYLCTVVGVQALVTGAWWVILDWKFKFIPNQKPQPLPTFEPCEKRVCANTMHEVQSAETEIGGSHPQQSTGFRKNQLPDGVGLPFHADSGYVDIIVVPSWSIFFGGIQRPQLRKLGPL